MSVSGGNMTRVALVRGGGRCRSSCPRQIVFILDTHTLEPVRPVRRGTLSADRLDCFRAHDMASLQGCARLGSQRLLSL
jgi:hypothetical protein